MPAIPAVTSSPAPAGSVPAVAPDNSAPGTPVAATPVPESSASASSAINSAPGEGPGPAALDETGHTVVLTAMIDVTTVVEEAGQLLISGAQLVTVKTDVLKMVEVVICTLELPVSGETWTVELPVSGPAVEEIEGPKATDEFANGAFEDMPMVAIADAEVACNASEVVLTCLMTVLDAGLQSKPML